MLSIQHLLSLLSKKALGQIILFSYELCLIPFLSISILSLSEMNGQKLLHRQTSYFLVTITLFSIDLILNPI